MQKFLSHLSDRHLVFMLVLMLIPFKGISQKVTIGDLDYSLNADGTAQITGLANKAVSDLVIPDVIYYDTKTYDVNTIGYGAFSESESIKSVLIPQSITKIKDYAFLRCKNLNFVKINDSAVKLTISGDGVFADCPIESIYYGRNISYEYSSYAPFRDKETLQKIEIGSMVSEINTGAFRDCPKLTNIEIPESVISIYEKAFYNCTSLVEVKINDGTDELKFKYPDIFSNCPLKNLYIGRNIVYDFSSSLLSKEHVFKNKKTITSVTISNTVSTITDPLFSGCTNLSEVNIEEGKTGLSIMVQGIFSKCPVESLYLGRNLEYAQGVYAPFRNISSLKNLSISNSVSKISNSAFTGCFGLTHLDIPNSVLSIGLDAFSNCSGLTNLEIPNSVRELNWNAFDGCTNLKSIKISDGSTQLSIMGEQIFANCPIEDVYLGRDLDYSSSNASLFKENNSLKM